MAHKSGLNYHDLLVAAIGTGSNYQAYVDGYFANKYNTAMWDGFSFDLVPMMNYTYQQFQVELKLNCMATYVNPDSKGKAQSTEGFSILSGTIPTLSTVLERDSKEVRDLMNIKSMNSGVSAVDVALEQLYKKTDSMLGSHVNSITYQRNQMVSNGKLELLSTNNPGGLQNITFSAQIPADNVTTLAGNFKWWTSAAHTTEGSTSDPIKDIKAKVKALKDVGVSAVTIEMDYLLKEDLLAHSKVVTAIGYNAYFAAAGDAAALAIGLNLDIDQRLLRLGNIVGATIKVVDHIAAVETWSKTAMAAVKTQIRSFAPDVLVFRPTGDIGTIKHVMPVIPPTGTTATYFNGSLLMRVYSDINTNIQYFNTEQAVLSVIDKPKYIHRLVVL